MPIICIVFYAIIILVFVAFSIVFFTLPSLPDILPIALDKLSPFNDYLTIYISKVSTNNPSILKKETQSLTSKP